MLDGIYMVSAFLIAASIVAVTIRHIIKSEEIKRKERLDHIRESMKKVDYNSLNLPIDFAKAVERILANEEENTECELCKKVK